MRLGMPIAAMMAFETTLFNLAAFLMGIIGATSLAAYAIVIQLCSISFMVPLGVNQAATVRVGTAYGAGDAAGVSRAGWAAYGVGVGFMALSALIMILMPHWLISLFIDTGSTTLIFAEELPQIAGLPVLTGVLRRLWLQMGPLIADSYLQGGRTMIDYHYPVVEALKRHDGAGAAMAIIDDIQLGGQAVLANVLAHDGVAVNA